MAQYTRESAVERLLESYKAYYNVKLSDEAQKPLRAICEFYEHSEKFVLSRKAEIVRNLYIFTKRRILQKSFLSNAGILPKKTV